MNQNTIELIGFEIEIPKLTPNQFILLRLIQGAIINNQVVEDSDRKYYIDIDSFKSIECKIFRNDLFQLLRKNVEIAITYNGEKNAETFHIINNCFIGEKEVQFTPAIDILKIVKRDSKRSTKIYHLENILFYGVRNKYTLLFLDYLVSQGISNTPKTINLTLSELKQILFLKDSQYKSIGSFKQYILDKIIPEILQKTHLNISYIEQNEPTSLTSTRKYKITHFILTFNLL